MDEVQQPPVLGNSVVEMQEVQQEDIDGGYGWVNIVCMLLLTAHTWGINGVSLFAELLSFILMLTKTLAGFWSQPYLLYRFKSFPRSQTFGLRFHRRTLNLSN